MLRCVAFYLLGTILLIPFSTAENHFIYPPPDAKDLKLKQGSTVDLKWDSNFTHVDLVLCSDSGPQDAQANYSLLGRFHLSPLPRNSSFLFQILELC